MLLDPIGTYRASIVLNVSPTFLRVVSFRKTCRSVQSYQRRSEKSSDQTEVEARGDPIAAGKLRHRENGRRDRHSKDLR
jgi:hypothetical protein